MKIADIRNVAIIAHVDHGKTTLVDQMLRQCGQFREAQLKGERILDSNDLERERGITILAKNTAIHYGGVKINIVDTPGHADFGGEVERVLSMVDGALLLVDAAEGPLPQTRFVLKKAFAHGLKVIVVINKIDRHDARAHEVLDLIFELFLELGANDEQLDFKVFYASAKLGFAKHELEDESKDMQPLFQGIIEFVPAPEVDADRLLQMQIITLDYNDYVGRIGIGKIFGGVARVNDAVVLIKQDSGRQVSSRITKLFTFEGLKRLETTEVQAGDLAALAGIEDIDIGDTLCNPEHPESLPAVVIDEPTISMTFSVNDSPLAGREGKFVTSRHILARLERETRANVALKMEAGQNDNEYVVKGRGELQLAILIENMRRESYELSVSRPKVITKLIQGKLNEPYEQLILDVKEDVSGAIINLANERQGDMTEMVKNEHAQVHLEYTIPSRGLIGFHSELMTLTRGEGIMHSSFLEYRLAKPQVSFRKNGTLVSMENGQSVAFGLWGLQERGEMFIDAGVDVYEGMIIGANNREGDMNVNPCKTKQLTNVRSKAADEAIRLTPPRKLSLEQALEFIEDDELVEVTPQNIRLRKKRLTEIERRRASRTPTTA